MFSACSAFASHKNEKSPLRECLCVGERVVRLRQSLTDSDEDVWFLGSRLQFVLLRV